MCSEFSCSSLPAEPPDLHPDAAVIPAQHTAVFPSAILLTALSPSASNGHISSSISSYPGMFSISRPFSQPLLKLLQLLPCADRRDMDKGNFLKHQHMEQTVKSLLEIQG